MPIWMFILIWVFLYIPAGWLIKRGLDKWDGPVEWDDDDNKRMLATMTAFWPLVICAAVAVGAIVCVSVGISSLTSIVGSFLTKL